MFDEWISIGDNCEFGLSLERVGYKYSSLFRFARADLHKIVKLLKNDCAGLFESITPVSKNMAMCNTYGISWHTEIQFEYHNNEWRFKDGEYCQESIDKEREKLFYLHKKFVNDLKYKRVLLYHKSNTSVDIKVLAELKCYIESISNNNNLIVIGCNEKTKFYNLHLCLPFGVVLEKINFFPSYADAPNYSRPCYDAIFAKYDLQQNQGIPT